VRFVYVAMFGDVCIMWSYCDVNYCSLIVRLCLRCMIARAGYLGGFSYTGVNAFLLDSKLLGRVFVGPHVSWNACVSLSRLVC
jgi:hypothetical protein